MTHIQSFILSKPYSMSHVMTEFYNDSVGKGLDKAKEYSLLQEWDQAIKECEKEARKVRCRPTLKDMQAFKSELAVLLECNNS